MWIFKLVRFRNLVIIAITQYLIQYRVIVPSLHEIGLNPVLNNIHFLLLVLATICVAAAGNVINDIFDVEIDAINREDSQVVGKRISIKIAGFIYYLLISLGLILSIVIAIQTNRLGLIFIFPLAIIMLHLYSKSWKSKGLIGNVVVSAFVAFVTGILLIAEFNVFENAQPIINGLPVLELLVAYILFSFFANLVREIIKDMEDVIGDSELNYKTYPIVHGLKKSKQLVAALLLILIIGLAYWILRFNTVFLENINGYSILLIFPFLIYIIYKLGKSQMPNQFHHLSTIMKITMILGLLYLLLFTI